MRKSIYTLVALVLVSLPSFAGGQTTAVTATITDTDSQVWLGGTWTATLVNPTPQIPPSRGGTPLTPSQLNLAGTMNGSGVLTGTFSDNAFVTPANTLWQFTVCPNASSQCGTVITQVTGATENLSTVLSAGIRAPRFNTGPNAHGYSDAEVSSIPVPGGTYFRVTDSAFRQWTGSAWTTVGTGGSGTSVTGPLQVPNWFTAYAPGTLQGPLVWQAYNIINLNKAVFTDNTVYIQAGPSYVGNVFISDMMRTCLSYPTGCAASSILNIMIKFDANFSSSLGYPNYLPNNFTAATTNFCSAFDLNCQAGTGIASGDGRIFMPVALWIYCQKEGLGSAECTTAYNTYNAHIKAAWALVPLDGTTHLYTVPTGPGSGQNSEFVCGTLFQEQMRFTGAVSGCNVWYGIDSAMMASIATASGNSADATYWSGQNALMAAGIQANLISGSSHLLYGATGQNHVDDLMSSVLAVSCDILPNIFPACNLLTSGQKTAIENYINTNYASIVNTNGFVIQTPNSGGWPTVGVIPTTGGPPYTSSPYTGTQYQGGFWAVDNGYFAGVLNVVNPLKARSFSGIFLNGVDPGCEWFNQGSGTCNGGTTYTASGASGAMLAEYFAPGFLYTAGTPCINKYGSQISCTILPLEFWQANEGSGSTYSNSGIDSTNSMTATNVTWGTTTGFTGSVAQYNGTSAYAEAANNTNTNFDGTTAFSACTWINTPGLSTDGRLISTVDASLSTLAGWDIYLIKDSSTTIYLDVQMFSNVATGDYLEVGSITNVSTDTIHHVCLTYNGSKTAAGVTIYLDGAALPSAVSHDALVGSIANTRPIISGALYNGTGNTFFFHGAMGYTRIYTQLLSGAQIASLYSAGPQ